MRRDYAAVAAARGYRFVQAEALGIALSLPKAVDDGARVANDVGP